MDFQYTVQHSYRHGGPARSPQDPRLGDVKRPFLSLDRPGERLRNAGVLGSMRRLRWDKCDGWSQSLVGQGLPHGHVVQPFASRLTGTRASAASPGTSRKDPTPTPHPLQQLSISCFKESERVFELDPAISGDRVIWMSQPRQHTSLDFPAFGE